MEFEQRRSSGTAKAGLATGIVGSTLGGLAFLGQGANLLGNVTGNAPARMAAVEQPIVVNGGCCNENMLVNRYEIGLIQELQNKDLALAEKDTEIKFKEAEIHTDQKSLELYQYIDGRLREMEQRFCVQEVKNQKTDDSILMVQNNLNCVNKNLSDKICDERRERICGDNTLVTYMNNMFYTQEVANITTGSTTTAKQPYNPLPIQIESDGCGCNC